MKTSVNSKPETDKDIMGPNEQEYKELLAGSLGIYRGALRNGKTQETALELATRHVQHRIFVNIAKDNKK